MMIWNNSNSDFPEPQYHQQRTWLDYFLWERDSDRAKPFEVSEYCDPAGFLSHYRKLEDNYVSQMEGFAHQRRNKVQGLAGMYECAFWCICDSWQETHRDYYRGMNYPDEKWFLDTLYWHVVSGYLKVGNQFYCQRCLCHYKSSLSETLELHHWVYDVEVKGETIGVPGSEHLFVTKGLVADFSLSEPLRNGDLREVPVLEVLCGDCHREVKGLKPMIVIK